MLRQTSEADQEADEVADHADRGAGDQEHAHDRALRRAHGAQDGDVAALVLHQHDQAGDDVERRHQHDQRQDQEHHVALDLQRVEEGRVALPPVDHEDRPLRGLGDELPEARDLVGIVGVDLDRGDVAGAVEIGLRLGQRHEHEGGVVFRHADLEHGGDLVGLDARRRAHRRHRAARRHQRDAVAGAQRELVGEPPADHDALPLVEAFQRALLDVAGDRGELVEVGAADAAHQHARGVERRRGQRLAFDDRHREPDARRPWRCARPPPAKSVSGDSSGCTSRWPLRPRILSSSSLRKPFITAMTMISVATPSMMPRKENAGDDRDESFLAPRPQVAQRQHPFERGERPCPGRFAHQSPSRTGFHPILAVSSQLSAHARHNRAASAQLIATADRSWPPGSGSPGCRRRAS